MKKVSVIKGPCNIKCQSSHSQTLTFRTLENLAFVSLKKGISESGKRRGAGTLRPWEVEAAAAAEEDLAVLAKTDFFVFHRTFPPTQSRLVSREICITSNKWDWKHVGSPGSAPITTDKL